MKALRIIKVIALITAIVTVLVWGAGSFFIIKDACDYSEQGVTADSVRAALDEYEFELKSLTSPFTAAAEEEITDEPAEDEPAEETAEEPVEAAVAEAEPEAEEPAEEENKDYALTSHANAVIALMKAANARVNLDFAAKLFPQTAFDNEFALTDGAFEVSLWLLIAFAASFVAFVLHCISKKLRKTFWGLVMMILGYLVFAAMFVAGNVIANIDFTAFFKVPSVASWRIWSVSVSTVAGFIFGLVFIRCGSRQMYAKYLKARIAKLKKHG